MRLRRALSRLAPCLGLAILLVVATGKPALAVPAFAAQTGQPCQDCHVGGFGPQLTPYGRAFKLGGYTRRIDFSAPVSMMAVESFVRTKHAQAAPPVDGFRRNDNLGLDQLSLFLAGGLGKHLGGFAQATYDGLGKSWSWDNLDLRATAKTQIADADVMLGASLNNAPTVEDAWNSLSAWGFPYTASDLAPSPAASPLLLGGGLAQDALGLTGYAWIDSKMYLEAGAYGSPGRNALGRLGADPFDPGDIDGLAPYGRATFQTQAWGGVLELGVSAMKAGIYPGRDRSTGLTDRYSDLGLDGSYYRAFANGDVLTLNSRYVHERQRLDASCALAGLASDCAAGHIDDVRADISYYWRDKIGATLAAFDTFGPASTFTYPDARTAKPDSSGIMLQVDDTLFGDGSSPVGPRFAMRAGAQLTHYMQFDGAHSNYDGAGAAASDNDTARVFLWFAY